MNGTVDPTESYSPSHAGAVIRSDALAGETDLEAHEDHSRGCMRDDFTASENAHHALHLAPIVWISACPHLII